NTFDAAVATGFALQIVEPHLNGPGGEVPILLYSAKNDRVDVICGQGVAPGAATIEAYRRLGLDLVPGTGLLAAVVPGAFDAWMLMLRDHGPMELSEGLAPALGYPGGGFAVVPNICKSMESVRGVLEGEWRSSAEVWLRDGGRVAGNLFRSPAVAETYRRLLREAEAAGGSREARIEVARRAWYGGFVAEALDRLCRTQEMMDSSGHRHGGLLTADDMARWSASVERPCTYDYHGYTLCKTGPWGQGPVALQQLALLKGFDLDDLSPAHPDFVHTVVECAKLAFADREAFYGDPDFVRVPMETLLSDAYNEQRRTLAGERASYELRPGHISGYGAAPIVRVARGAEQDIAHAGVHGAGGPTAA